MIGSYLLVQTVLFLCLFMVGDDEPLGVRLVTALLVAVFWPLLFVVLMIWLVGDAIDAWLKGARR